MSTPSVRSLIILVGACLCVGTAGQSRAQEGVGPEELGIDCAKAASTPEAALCAAKDFEDADKQLNAAYSRVLKTIDAADVPAEGREGWRKALVQAQRRWVAFRDTECELVGFEWYGGTGRNGAVATCLATLTKARTEDLKRHEQPE